GTPQYAGVATLVLALFAVATVPWRRTAFWVASAAIGVLLSFGGATSLYYFAYLFLPGFGASRNQERAVMLPALAMALLAAYGVAAVLDRRRGGIAVGRVLWRALLAALLFGAVLYAGTRLPAPPTGINLFGGMLKQHVWLLLGVAVPAAVLLLHRRGWLAANAVAALLVALVGLNLFIVNHRYNLGAAPAAVTQPSRGTATALRWTLAPGARLASGGLLPEGPSAGMIYDLPDTSGNTPLQSASYARFTAAVPEWRRWQLLAVSHVVLSAGAEPAAGLEPALDGPVNLYRIADLLPPVHLVHSVVEATGESVWSTLADPAFDPEEAVILGERPAALAPATGDESAVVLLWQPEEIVVEVDASAAAVLVLAQVAYPGWQATVDGADSTWQTGDGLLIAVPVEAGNHTIRLLYRPASIMLGTAVSLAAALAVLLLACQPKVLSRWLHVL
ncbi:MAG: YfhO family protein, partial [Anaerolineae bacterium]